MNEWKIGDKYFAVEKLPDGNLEVSIGDIDWYDGTKKDIILSPSQAKEIADFLVAMFPSGQKEMAAG